MTFARFRFITTLGLIAASVVTAHAGSSRSQKCAERMAGFVDLAPVVRAPVVLTAQELEDSKTLQLFLEGSRGKADAVTALQRSPRLIEVDPDSALRAALFTLIHFEYHWVAGGPPLSLKWIVPSAPLFSQARLSQAEVKGFANAVLSGQQQGAGMLLYSAILGQGTAESKPSTLEFFLQAMAAVARQADQETRSTFLRSFESGESGNGPFSMLRNLFWLDTPGGLAESSVRSASFRRLWGSGGPPQAVLHTVEGDRIRLVASHPFEGSLPGILSYERTFTPEEFRRLLGQPKEIEKLFSAPGQSGQFKVDREAFESLLSANGTRATRRIAPTYEAWARDGKVQGLIWADSGFSASEAGEVLKEYAAFYQAHGFRFSTEKLADFPKWLLERVKSGELDYMFREGHVAQNLSMRKSGKLMIGKKPGSPSQEVVIFMPDAGSDELRVDWKKMDEALSARSAKSPENEFLYFDTKCAAFGGAACPLARQLESSNIRIIGAEKAATTFVNDPSSAIHSLLEGVLNQESYAKVQKRLARLPPTDDGDDRYILPHTRKYRDWVGDIVDLKPLRLEWQPR
jgi:hypothetical protein